MNKNHVVLGGIILFALLLRLYGIEERGIWFDEKVSISHSFGATMVEDSLINNQIKKGNIRDFWMHQEDIKYLISGSVKISGGNAIVYAVLLRYWIDIFGLSEFSIRFLSVIFSLLSIVILFKLTLLMSRDSRIALGAAFCLSLSHLSIEYSHEARSYAMGTFFSLVSTWMFFRIMLRPKEKNHVEILIYVIANLVALLCHYFTLIVLFGQGVYFILSKPQKIQYVRMILAYALFAAAVVFLFYQYGEYATDSLVKGNEGWAEHAKDPNKNINASFRNIVFEYFQVSTHLFGVGLHYFNIRLRMYVFLLLIPSIFLWFGYKYAKKNDNLKLFVFPCIVFLGHLLLMTISSIISTHTLAFVPKYSIFISPYMFVVLSVGMFFFFERYGKKSLVLIAIQCGLIFLPAIAVYKDMMQNVGYGCVRIPNPYKPVMDSVRVLNSKANTPILLQTAFIDDIKTIAFYSNENDRIDFELVPDLDYVLLVKQKGKTVSQLSLNFCE